VLHRQPAHRRLYYTEPAAGLNGRKLRYPRGKVLGGCSSINGMVCMRGQARDHDGWAAATGDARWRWSDCLPCFKRHEDHWRGADAAHAAPGFDPKGERPGGEWRVERQRLSWEILDAFDAAAQEAGIPATDDFNRGNNEGVGYFDVNQRSGIRWSATKAFLRPVQHRPNLQDHLQIRAVFAVQGVKTLNTLASSWWGKGLIGLEYLLRRSGPMGMAPSQLGCFTRSAPGFAWPNVQYHVHR